MRARLCWIKHVLAAVILLALAVCGVELGLRVQDSYTGEFSPTEGRADGLVIPCRQMHHRLRPLAIEPSPGGHGDVPVIVQTNSLGLRGPEPAFPKPTGVLRIICLGDDTVLAAELPDEDTFCRQLQHLLQQRTRFRVEVINAGVPGYCPLLCYLQARHVLLGLQPDVLVLNFDMNDVADDYRYRRHARLDEALNPVACPHPQFETRPATSTSSPWDRFFIARWCKRRFAPAPERAPADEAVEICAPGGRFAWLRDDPPDWSVYLRQALDPVGRLKRAADEAYAPLVLATYPAPWQVSATASSGAGVRETAGVAADAHFASRRPFELLADYAALRAIAFCDVSPAFLRVESPDALFLDNVPRFSIAGHRLYARQLAECVVSSVPGVWLPDGTPRNLEPTHDAPVRQAAVPAR